MPDAAAPQAVAQPIARERGTITLLPNGVDDAATHPAAFAQDLTVQDMSEDGWSQVPSRKNKKHPQGGATGL